MKKYVAPLYEVQEIKTDDIIMSSVQNAGMDTLQNVTGIKGIFQTNLDDIY